MPTISLLGTGGTISTGRTPEGAAPQHSVGELAQWARGHDCNVCVRSRDVLRTSSRAMTPQLMHQVAEAVKQEIDEGADGVVITHGTDTLEETAYALALLIDTSVPVVLTGAMRPPYHAGSDGPANLAAAITAATDHALAAYGPVVVHQDEVHLARWVTKLHSTRVAAFASPQAGPVAAIVEGCVVLLHGPATFSERLPVTAVPDQRVELLWAVAGADGLVVDAIGRLVDGLVVAGTGGGHVAPLLAESLVQLVATGRPVVLASRCASPQVLAHTYAGRGSETQLLGDGLISAGSLSPLKARLRLIFALSAGMAAQNAFSPICRTS